ncbi:MAG: type II toxin-antitoxin system VapC family toxin, partial [Methanosarcinales archaeon]
DTTVLATAFSPSDEEIKTKKHLHSIKVLSRIKKKENKGYTSYLNIVEFIGVLSEKSNKSASFIEEKVELIEKDFGVNIIYPSYRVPIDYEFEKTSDALQWLLKEWTNDVKKISVEYRLGGLDASHLLTAIENECTRFITWDRDFLRNPNLEQKRIKELKYIQITSPAIIT